MPDPSVPSASPQAATGATRLGAEPSPAAASPIVDEPSPSVDPIYLRRGRRPRRRERALQVPEERHGAQASLVDAIAAKVLESLALTLRESVHAAVLELAPRMAVELPEPRAADAAEVAQGEQVAEAAGADVEQSGAPGG